MKNNTLYALSVSALVALVVACILGAVVIYFVPENEPIKHTPPLAPNKTRQAAGSDLIGQSLKDFPDQGLVNEEGKRVSFKTLPHQPVLLSFIYTRCPMPTMCPRITKKMRTVQKKMRQVHSRVDQGQGKQVYFVSVTFDPDYDTPKVLKQYGKSYDIDMSNWDFWTGPSQTIKQLTGKLNIQVSSTANGRLMHNMRTYVLDKNRIVQAVYRGSGWNPQAITKRLQAMVAR